MDDFTSENDAVEKALAIVDAIPDEELTHGDAHSGSEQDTSETSPSKEASPSAEDGHSEHDDEAQPDKVTAPRSWKADAKELFEKLPPELQQQVLTRESEQNSTFNRIVNEQREAKRQADDARTKAAEQERLYQENLQQISQAVRFHDPILAAANATDWDKLNRENPSEYVSRKHELEKHVNFLQNIEREQNRLQGQQFEQTRQRELEQLFAKMPDMADEAKASQIRQKAHSTLIGQYGFTQQELNQILDHRTFLALVDAAKYHELMASKTTMAAKKTTAPVRVATPQASRDTKQDTSENFRALRQRAIKSGREDDAVAAVLAAIGD